MINHLIKSEISMPLKLTDSFLHYIAFKPLQEAVTVKEIFHVGPIQISQSVSPSLLRKIIYGVSSIATIGLLPITHHCLSRLAAKCILPALTVSTEDKNENKEAKEAFLKLMSETSHEFDLKMEDGAIINGMTVFKDRDTKKDFCAAEAKEQKWIIHFNGNMQFYEDNLFDAQYHGKNHDANVLIFNYRGVGESKGSPLKADDLIADGEACVKYLLSKGVLEENILIEGFSLGGGIGVQVASLHEKIGLENGSSFSTLSKAASALLNCSAVGKILIALDWELDSVSAYEKIKASKWIFHHKQDAIISYEASLYKGIKEQIKKLNPDAVTTTMHKGKLKNRLKEEFKPIRVKLQRKFRHVTPNAHNYDVKSDPAYPKIKEHVRDFFSA
jgi:alpha/beta superfamily hydrolase